MDQRFKEAWLKNLSNYSKKKYGLSDGDKERCVMAVARETAVELEILPDCDMQGRDLLTDDELRAIGISPEAQYYLSTVNDQFTGVDASKFGKRLLNAIENLPVTKELVLIPIHKEDK